MKIQYISRHISEIKTKHMCEYSTFSAPKAFDSFDINIISLQDEYLWKTDSLNTESINAIKDFKSLAISIQNSKKAKIIVLFPQNYNFTYSGYSCKIKDILSSIYTILSHLLPEKTSVQMVYELSQTECCGEVYGSDFYFQNKNHNEVLTKNLGAEKPTTIKVGNYLIYTTLNIKESVDSFIVGIGLDDTKNNEPDWIKSICFYDDEKQEEIIRKANEEMHKLQDIVRNAEKQIEKNSFYKSVLYENGNNLAAVVFEMLEQFMNISLSDFIDEKKEDFKIVLDDVTFIGEIKGITSNVKNDNISQLDVHYQRYIDELQASKRAECVKGLLIINPLRSKPLSEREPVHENQIKLAQRNESLIITTEVLLLLFSNFLEGAISSQKVIELFKTKTGLLEKSDFIN